MNCVYETMNENEGVICVCMILMRMCCCALNRSEYVIKLLGKVFECSSFFLGFLYFDPKKVERENKKVFVM